MVLIRRGVATRIRFSARPSTRAAMKLGLSPAQTAIRTDCVRRTECLFLPVIEGAAALGRGSLQRQAFSDTQFEWPSGLGAYRQRENQRFIKLEKFEPPLLSPFVQRFGKGDLNIIQTRKVESRT